MKRFLFLALLLLTAPAAGQVAVDTVWVTVEGPLFSTTITTVERLLTVGDTVHFVAVAHDEQGADVTALFTWSSSRPDLVNIDAVTGMAIALQKDTARVAISVLTEQVERLVLASFRDGNLNFSGFDTLFLNTDSLGNQIGPFPTLQYCAYLLNPWGYMVAQDPGPPTCPLAFAQALSTYAMFRAVPRVRPLLEVRPG